MLTLKNQTMEITVNPLGAELSGIKVNGQERQWNGDARFWTGRAPVLFPICGGLKDGMYRYGGKRYYLPQHGFAKYSLFTVESVTATTAVLRLSSDDYTRQHYPFDFVFRVTFSLTVDGLMVCFAVTNPGRETLRFSVGSHEAFACPEGVAAYDIVFEQPETLPVYEVTGPLLDYRSRPFLSQQTTFSLKDEDFAVDALIFTGMASEKVSLVNRATRAGVTVSYSGCSYLLLWTKPGAPYLCIEPWNGCPDSIDSDGEWLHKKGLLSVEPGETLTHTHQLSFF